MQREAAVMIRVRTGRRRARCISEEEVVNFAAVRASKHPAADKQARVAEQGMGGQGLSGQWAMGWGWTSAGRPHHSHNTVFGARTRLCLLTTRPPQPAPCPRRAVAANLALRRPTASICHFAAPRLPHPRWASTTATPCPAGTAGRWCWRGTPRRPSRPTWARGATRRWRTRGCWWRACGGGWDVRVPRAGKGPRGS